MGVLIDTSAFIEVERAGGDPVDLVPVGADRTVLPAIVYAELQVGVRLARSASAAARRRAKVEILAMRVPIVGFDRAIAERWADLFADLRHAGVSIPSNDLAVAATALHLGFGVLLASKGEKHFEAVPGLTITRLAGR